MPVIRFDFKNFLGEDLENGVCRITPTQPTVTNGIVLLNSPIYVSDGDVLLLPSGIYTAKLSGSNTSIRGWFQVTSVDASLSDILNITVNPADIPQSLPISAVQGLQAELDGKLDSDNLILTRIPTTSQLSKLNSVESGATQNFTNDFLLNRANHTGTQPISSVFGLQVILDSKLEQTSLNPINTQITSLSENQITSSERSKLSGIQSGATVNSTDAQLRDRSTHTGTQPISSITGLGSAATRPHTDFQPSNTRLTSLSTEPNPTTPKLFRLGSDGGVTFIDPVTFNGRSGSIIPQLSDYSSFFIQPESSPTLTSLSLRFNPTVTVPISAYEFNPNERGISLPLLRVTGGRIDFNSFEGKAEFRVNGTTTQLGFFNSDLNVFYIRVTSDGDSFIRRHLWADGNLVAGNTNTGNHRLFVDGNARLRTSLLINNNANLAQILTDGATTSLEFRNTTNNTRLLNLTSDGDAFITRNLVAAPSNPNAHKLYVLGNSKLEGSVEITSTVTSQNTTHQRVQSTPPASPTLGTRWLEVVNNLPVASWTWDGTRWITRLTSYTSPSNSNTSGDYFKWLFPNPGYGSGIIINSLVYSIRANGEDHTANDFLNIYSAINRLDGTQSGIGSTYTTQTVTSASTTRAIITPSSPIIIAWDLFSSLETSVWSSGVERKMNYRGDGVFWVYR